MLENVHTLVRAACQRTHLRASAIRAIELLTLLPALPAAEGFPPERVSGIAASEPYRQLARFFLRRGIALVWKATAAAAAAGAPAGRAHTLGWAAELRNLLLEGAAGFLWQPVVELLPAAQVQEGITSWLAAAMRAWQAGGEGQAGRRLWPLLQLAVVRVFVIGWFLHLAGCKREAWRGPALCLGGGGKVR